MIGALLRRWGAPLAILAVCALVLALIQHVGRDIDYRAMMRAFRHLPSGLVWGAILATALSYVSLIARDVGAMRYAGIKVPLPALLVGSFCGTALGNTVGFGALAGGAVRYRIYGGFGATPEQIARMMAFITVTFAVGLAAYAAVNMVIAAPALSRLLHTPPLAVQALGGAILLGIGGLLALCMRGRNSLRPGRLQAMLPDFGLSAAQLVLTAIDMLTAALALWLLLPAGKADFASFSAVFAVATALGVLSHVPGGMGVFEAVVVFSLGKHGHANANAVAAALLAYRAIYFLLPLLLAAGVLALFELRRAMAGGGRVLRAAGSLAPTFLGVVTFSIGAMLLMSGATPAFHSRLALLQQVMPLWVLEGSNFIASLTGVVLLFVARGLFHRLDGAWLMAVAIALLNLGLSIAKGLALLECSVIASLIVLLVASRHQFTRPASLLRQPLTPGWLAAITVVIAVSAWVMFLAFRDVDYSDQLWWQFEFDAQAPRALRATLGAGVLALGVALYQLLRPARRPTDLPAPAELEQVERIIRQQDRSDAMLTLMGDKSLLFSASGQAALAYARHGRTWVALYDPVGPREEWPELIWRFVEMADAQGGRVAFYEVRPETLPLYLDAGLKVVKIGEEARIRLAGFGLEGSAGSAYRYTVKRGDREGFELEFLPPGAAAEQMDTLRAISDSWLAQYKGREKGFSVATFDPRFVAGQWVALLRENGRPVAFVSAMATDFRREATVALMRHTPDASRFAMEYIFIRLALHLKAVGFEVLSLGMAPLAGMARNPLASSWHRFAGLFWRHGGRLYSFQGLRAFKAKFRPEWEPRYLAVSGSFGPFMALADVVVLAGGGGR